MKEYENNLLAQGAQVTSGSIGVKGNVNGGPALNKESILEGFINEVISATHRVQVANNRISAIADSVVGPVPENATGVKDEEPYSKIGRLHSALEVLHYSLSRLEETSARLEKL